MSESNIIDIIAIEFYERDGFNFACLPTAEAWAKDREDVRERYRKLAWEKMNGPDYNPYGYMKLEKIS